MPPQEARQQRTASKDIGGPIRLLAVYNFRRDIASQPRQEFAIPRFCSSRHKRIGQGEIRELAHALAVDDDTVRMHSPVRNAVFMSVRQSAENPHRDCQSHVVGKSPTRFVQERSEVGWRIDSGSDDNQTSVLSPSDLLGRNNIRMHQFRCVTGIPSERYGEVLLLGEIGFNNHDTRFPALAIATSECLAKEADRKALIT